MKYQGHRVTFAEIPDEITLCIEIAGCKLHCPGCHSPWLWEDKGKELTIEELNNLIAQNPGITCVCLMGGDELEVEQLLKQVKGLKKAWYTGLESVQLKRWVGYLHYLKVGPYIKELGPLTSKTTNQKLYRIDYNDMGMVRMDDITSKFWQDKYRENGGATGDSLSN